MTTETQVKEIEITVHSDQGKPKFKLKVNSNILWGELRSRLQKEGYNMDKVEAVNNINKASFNSPKGIMPQQDFNLHLFPVETKGGALSRSEAYTKVKGYILLGSKAEAYFNEGKNYTTKKTAELEVLIAKWEKKHGTAVGETPADKQSSAAVKPSQQKALTPKAPKVKGAVKTTAPAVIAPPVVVLGTDEAKIKAALNLIVPITGHENQSLINDAMKSLEKSLIPKPTKSEDQILAEEHDDLREGLNLIRGKQTR